MESPTIPLQEEIKTLRKELNEAINENSQFRIAMIDIVKTLDFYATKDHIDNGIKAKRLLQDLRDKKLF